MKTTEIKVKIGNLLNGYEYTEYDSETDKGVYTNVNLDGEVVKLNIRPKYQRNFVYDQAKQEAVIDSIMRGYPLNKMYWYKNADGTYGILDGQQRTLSILRFSKGLVNVGFDKVKVSSGSPTYNNEPPCRKYGNTFKEAFENYPLDICICEEEKAGDREQWFERINISNSPLTTQELRNANYVSDWLDDAKYHFSRLSWIDGIPTSQKVLPYMKGVVEQSKTESIERQGCLERAIEWVCKRDGIKGDGDRDAISVYMGNCRDNKLERADNLVNYINEIINFAKQVFPNYNHFKKIKDADWQNLFELYHNNEYNSKELEMKYDEIVSILEKEHTMDSSFKVDYVGVFDFLLSNGKNVTSLSKRAFTDNVNKEVKYEEQKGICPHCGNHFEINEMECDHIIPFSQGGKTRYINLQLLCKTCNCKKGNKLAI